MRLKIFKRNLVHTLYQSVEQNLELYENGDFSELLSQYSDQIRDVPDVFYDETMFGNMVTDAGGVNDSKNAYIILEGLQNFNPYLATDERVWCALCHMEGKQFASTRWIKSSMADEKKIKAIRQHFFARGNRGFERQNALSSIWWWGYVATRHDPNDRAKAIETFCKNTDVRSQILDRTSISRGVNTLAGIMKCIERKMTSDPDTTFFTRQKTLGAETAPYRDWFSKINRWGGRKFIESFDADELTENFYHLLLDVEQNKGDL